jgi:hypothetical protein
MKRVLMHSVSLFFGLISVAQADSVDSAYRLCAALDATGMLSKPCSVSGWGRSVDAYIDTNASEARSMCSSISKMMADQGTLFPGGWQLKIYSPYSNGNTIAYCNLPE